MNNRDLKLKVRKICSELLYKQGYISSVDVLLRIGYLSPKDHRAWRHGKISCLEKACQANLKKLTIVNKILRLIANELKLKRSKTAYKQWGKNKKRDLIFSVSGSKKIEDHYKTHFLDTIWFKKKKENEAK